MVRQVVRRNFQIIAMFVMAIGLGGCCLHQASHAEKTYCVIDLTRKSNDGTYFMSWLDDVPEGGWSLEHKTRKLVLRRIPSGRFKFLGKYDVEITRPFYIGVFEFTCAQYELLTGKSVVSIVPARLTEDQPLGNMKWEEVCGEDVQISKDGVSVGVDGFAIPKENSLMGMLSQKTGRRFSLPTEAQWEYACRAGVDTAFNIGNAGRDDWETMRLCGCSRFVDPNLRFENFRPITHVGAYRPNRWGLYDMHGNLEEMCLDEFETDAKLSAVFGRGVVDPCFNYGPKLPLAYVAKGGCLLSHPPECTTTSRVDHYQDWPDYFVGFRVVMEACD